MSIIDIFNEKLQDIKDMAEGKTELMNMDAENVENLIDEKQLWEMFENIKNKVLSMDLSKNAIGNGVVDSLDIDESLGDDVGLRWFEGSFYVCKHCNRKEYGENAFRYHLKKIHNVLKNIHDHYSKYEQKHYNCKICSASINHDYSSLYQHIKKEHFISIVEYEAQFKNKEMKNAEETVNEELTKHSETSDKPKQATLKILSPSFINDFILINQKTSISANNPGGQVERKEEEQVQGGPNQNISPPTSPKPMVNIRPKLKPSRRLGTKSPQPPSPSSPTVGSSSKNTTLESSIKNIEITKVVEVGAEDQEVVAVKREPVEQRIKRRTLFYCPLGDVDDNSLSCPYNTTKDGFTNGEAARHLKNVHKLRPKDMKPGMYKFNKVKIEL